jgi:hypothetical protein
MIKDTDLIFNEYLIGIVFSIMKFQLFLLSPLSSLLSPLSSPSRPPAFPVKAAVLDGFGQMFGGKDLALI